MMESVLEIPRIKWEKQRNLDLDKGFKDALRDYCARRWPHHTAKYAARNFDLTHDQGRSVANGTASLTTIERAFKKGGPVVAIPILEEVLGVQLAGFFRDALFNSAEGASNALDHQDHARAAYGRLAMGADRARADRDDAPSVREAGRSFGAMGAETPRRVGSGR